MNTEKFIMDLKQTRAALSYLTTREFIAFYAQRKMITEKRVAVTLDMILEGIL